MKKTIYLIILLGLCSLACSATLVKPVESQIGVGIPTPLPLTVQAGTSGPETRTVTAANLNLRKASNLAADVMDWLHAGDQLTILKDVSASGWLHVQVGGRSGWINSNYLRKE